MECPNCSVHRTEKNGLIQKCPNCGDDEMPAWGISEARLIIPEDESENSEGKDVPLR